MSNKTINDHIQDQIDHTLQQQPKPELITITKIYPDNTHVDCKTLNNDTIEYVNTISNNLAVNNPGVLLTLANQTLIIITR